VTRLMIHHLSPIRMSLSFGQTAAHVAAPALALSDTLQTP